MSGAILRVGRRQLNVERSGAGERPLLLIQGLGGSTRLWAPLMEALDRPVVSFDQPGTGASPPPTIPMRIPRLARLTVALLDELGIARADVLGYSFGGLVAQQLAHDAPSRVRRLILAATHYGVRSIQPPASIALRLINPMRNYSQRYARRTLPKMVGGRTAADPFALEVGIRLRHGARPSWRGYWGQVWAATGWGSNRWLSGIRQPTLVIQGDDDPLVLPDNGRHMAATIPDCRLELIPGAGHLFLVDEPESAMPAINEFLSADDHERVHH